MKILLDQNIDRRLKDHLSDFDCATVHEMGWSDVQNGQLLSLAEANGFEALLTADADANFDSQQNLAGRAISIVILRPSTDGSFFRLSNKRLATHIEMLGSVRAVLSKVGKGEVAEVFHRK